MTKSEYKRMSAEIRMLRGLVKFADGIFRDLVKVRIENADIANVWFFEQRRRNALFKVRKRIEDTS